MSFGGSVVVARLHAMDKIKMLCVLLCTNWFKLMFGTLRDRYFEVIP